ncbi:MAG: hypothetical protein JXR45_13975 [Deltaproteobacteria bacterium]|nr:hypothetical protein [Deltaproteobacteria bacterium]
MKIILAAFLFGILDIGCNTISSTCTDGDVWLRVTDVNGGDLAGCESLQVLWTAQTISGTAQMPLDGGEQVSEAVFLLSTQNDDDFDNDIPIGTTDMMVAVICKDTTVANDVFPIAWETTTCEGKEVLNAAVGVEINLTSIIP